jgi:peptidyl-prolyl cis-trans isomerase SurA
MANPTVNPASCTDRRRTGAAFIATLLCALCCVAAPLRAQTVAMEAVVAVVDDDIVLASEYQYRLKQVTENLERQKVQQMPPQEVLARQVLDRLILERIQLQMAERAGVQISDAQLNEAIGTMAAQNGLTLEQFKTSLESQGESYTALRNQVRQEMTLQRVQQGNVRSRIQVTEQEVTDFLASEEGQKRTSAVYHIAHLLLPLPEGATLDDERKAKEYVERLRAGLLEGDTFERFIRNPDKSQYPFTGGDLGWRPASDLPGIFAEAVPKLEVHAVSDPVRSASGLHLVKLLEKRGGAGQIMQQTKARHILLKPSEIRTPDQTRELAAKLRERVLAGEDFGTLAKEFSEDLGSQAEGGELGWVNPGQMVPEFEKVMAQTANSEVSAPFESNFGWHILQVEDRRTQDLSDEMRRNQARNILFGQKYEDELAVWLQKIRDEAFVEIKI